MKSRQTIIVGMLLMAGGVTLGAFGAHALKVQLAASGRSEVFELGIRYLLIHAIALIGIGWMMEKYHRLRFTAILILSGIIFFSGSLLTLALMNNPGWGAVAPVGGTLLIAGWLSGAWLLWRGKE